MHNDCFSKPANLSPEGERAYETIMAFLTLRALDHSGGCKVFYSPEEWKARGEDYGTKSHLIVVYDGGSHRIAFNLDHECYDIHNAMNIALENAGLYLEECTCWYGAIYSR